MKIKQPTMAEWKRLYELAAELKRLAPWEWMEESEIFGVENPETGELGFVSVMGLAGEHLSIAVYRGAKGLYDFWDFREKAETVEPLAMFEIQQLQVSFEDRQYLEKEDREIIKKLGLKFRGSQNYPIFRRMGDGFMPWLITSEDARLLICAIEQALEVAVRVREDRSILTGAENDVYLVRAAVSEGGKFVWSDERRRIARPTPEKISVAVPADLLAWFKSFPQNKKLVFELDSFYLPTPVVERGERPFFPKMLLAAEAKSEMILGAEMLKPDEDAAAANAAVFEAVTKIWAVHEVLPKEIRVRSEPLFELLKDFTQKLNVGLKWKTDLTALDNAQEAMFGFLGGLDF